MPSNVKAFRPFAQKPAKKPRINPNEAFIRADEILLTAEGFQQIQELAEALANPTTGANA